MSLTFTNLWQEQELSDLDVVLKAPADAENDAGRNMTRVATFPGHRALLSNSPVFKAQILRWQDDSSSADKPAAKKKCTRRGDSLAAASAAASAAAPASTGDSSSRPQLVLELQDHSQQPAAMAVLSSLYLLKPLPELLSELSQEQQLQAAVLADMWQVPGISASAAQLLADSASVEGGLSEAVKQPLLKSLLLSVFGDLEAVWADAELKKQLLRLPVSSMKVLLSCAEVKVATQDTVFYTVLKYLDDLTGSTAQAKHARQQLGPLIRCQHLSLYWLTASVVSDAAACMPLAGLRPHVKKLALLRNTKGTQARALTGQNWCLNASKHWRVLRPAGDLAGAVTSL